MISTSLPTQDTSFSLPIYYPLFNAVNDKKKGFFLGSANYRRDSQVLFMGEDLTDVEAKCDSVSLFRFNSLVEYYIRLGEVDFLSGSSFILD